MQYQPAGFQHIQQGALAETEEVAGQAAAGNVVQEEDGQHEVPDGMIQDPGVAEVAAGKGKKKRKGKAADKVVEKLKLEERQKRLQQQLLQQRAALQKHAEQQGRAAPTGAEYYVIADQSAEDDTPAPGREEKGNGRPIGNVPSQPGPSWAQGAAWQPPPPPPQYAWPPMGLSLIHI